MKNLITLDCEVYPNYFLVAFKNIDTGKTISIKAKGEDNGLSKKAMCNLNRIMMKRTTFGFNSINYDMPVILYALKGASCEMIHKMSDFIIDNNAYGWQVLQKFNLFQSAHIDHFDIQEPSPGVRVSLKLYGGRMHSKRLQDLPIEPGTLLTNDEMDDIQEYCINDLNTNIDLYRKIEDRIELRRGMSKKYDQNLMSKSDAQIAEAVIKSELQKKNPRKKIGRAFIPEGTTYRYNTPKFISFKSKQLNEVLDIIQNHDFELDKKGSIKLPSELKKMKITLGHSKYQIGIGGLHSNEKKQTIIPTKYQVLADRDAEAFYPKIILNLGLYPKHLGKSFLDIYRNIVEERIRAKKSGNKVLNESLKIVINGSFGKLGNHWSILHSPDSFMTVTLTGQLSLLMLIERLEAEGISVMSANTDGFVSLMNKDQYELYDDLCFDWELETGFELEETQYSALYSRDINNYLAVKTDGEIKGKGIFTINELSKNPSAIICITAVKDYLTKDIEIEDTIRECKDIRQFVTVRTVAGGATWKNQYLGRVVRWIYSTQGTEIYYKKPNKTGNHNKVAKSDGARPIMELGEFPKDIDYERYIQESEDILETIGFIDF